METRQIILDTLKDLGFEVRKTEGFGYSFKYEGRHYVYAPNENDEDFLSIAIPFVEEYNEEDSKAFYQLMDKLNSARKYVKAYMIEDGMWLFYERELYGDENFKALLPRMIVQLDVALHFLRKYKDELDSDDESEEEVDDDDTDNDNEQDVA